MSCAFTPAQTPDLKISVCSFMLDGKVVASSNPTADIDNSYKQRAKLAFEQKMCQLNLTGFSEDKPKNFTCNIKQTASTVATKSAMVEKSETKSFSLLIFLKTVSFCVIQTMIIPC